MPTVKPDCGCCGKDFQFTGVKPLGDDDYGVSFDGCAVQPLLWQVREKGGCQTVWKQGTSTCVSGPIQCTINLADVPNGVYEIVGNSPNCNGNGLAFTFIIGDVDEETSTPLTAPVLSALGINANTIRLNWTHAGAEDFLTQYSIDGEAWAEMEDGIFDGALRTADTTPWDTDTLYFFRMQARLADGTVSNFSNVVTATASAVSTSPHSRKVLVHNAIEWDFINLTANNSKVAKVVDGGATHVTILLQWWDYEPHQDVYDFTKLDNAVAYFESYGLKSLIQIPYRFAYNGMLNNSPNAYISTGAAILFRSGNRALSNVEGAVGCKANPAYADRQLKLVARIFDHVNNNALLKANAKECLFIDGASNETGFFTGSYAGNIDDGDFNNATNNDFQLFLQDKYHGNISELNTAWGRSFVTFHAIQVGDYQPTLYGGSYIGYSENQRTKDWFEYMCVSHKLFYRRIIQAVKNPQSVDPTLSSTNTGIRVACYWTEPYTGQGIFWGSGIINMLSEFDIVFSSRGASDGSHVGGNHLISFAQAIDTMLGCFPAQECGQEMDSDVLFANGHRIGPSRLARCIYSRGAEWMIYVFYDEIADWDEDVYYSINGDTLTFLQDSQLAVSEYVTGQNRTIPTPSQTLSFDMYDVLDNVFNPNNVVTDWVELVDPDAEGLSSVYVQISMDEILS